MLCLFVGQGLQMLEKKSYELLYVDYSILEELLRLILMLDFMYSIHSRQITHGIWQPLSFNTESHLAMFSSMTAFVHIEVQLWNVFYQVVYQFSTWKCFLPCFSIYLYFELWCPNKECVILISFFFGKSAWQWIF